MLLGNSKLYEIYIMFKILKAFIVTSKWICLFFAFQGPSTKATTAIKKINAISSLSKSLEKKYRNSLFEIYAYFWFIY